MKNGYIVKIGKLEILFDDELNILSLIERLES